VVLSEYGITPVDQPVHLNRLFRAQGWLAIKDELGLETLDCGASRVFAVADHQVAHIYINDRSLETKVQALLRAEPGVELVLNRKTQVEWGINHRRSGDLVAVAGPDSWFTYYYWLDDALAPDFARTVDIHRKIGYDPAELFIDPKIQFPKLAIAMHLFRKNLGLRSLMRIIPLDAGLVAGSHGRLPESELDWPLLMLEKSKQVSFPLIPPRAEQVYEILLRYINTGELSSVKRSNNQSVF
jgi:predicted AlkP superfamily pyrophosphatase or phosphodiesterase